MGGVKWKYRTGRISAKNIWRKETMINQALSLVEAEYNESNKKHAADIASYHEGVGLLEEEFTELKAEVFRKEWHQNPAKILLEAKQVANIAVKIMLAAMRQRKKEMGSSESA